MKTLPDQIADLEANIDRLQTASKMLFVLSDGAKKRFLDIDELKALSQVATAETRAHAALMALRLKQMPGDEDLDRLTPEELLKRIEAAQGQLEDMRSKLKLKAVK